METRGYSSKKLHKSAKVYSNDPGHKIESLQLGATIRTAISVSNSRIVLKDSPGETVSRVVEIKAEREKRLLIETFSYDLNDKVDYRLETVKEGKFYRIHFENKPGATGNFHGSLKLKTNYEERPTIVIRIAGRFKR